MPKQKLILITLFALVALIGASFIGTGYFYYRYQQTQNELGKLLTNPQQAFERENKYIIEKVSSIMTVPADEVPEVITLNNNILDQFKNQPFFAQAKVGDKFLIYPKARKAILYDPVANKIKEVGPINIPSPTGAIEGVGAEEANPPQPKTPTASTKPEPSPTPTEPPINP